MVKKTAAAKPLTKTELFNNIAEATSLSKKDVAAVFDALTEQVSGAIKAGGAGAFTLPGLLKIVVQHKPATKKRQVRNPATGEMVWSGPKPARNVVKVRPLKALKDMVE
jgi:nucleoid DNA-binding protein